MSLSLWDEGDEYYEIPMKEIENELGVTCVQEV